MNKIFCVSCGYKIKYNYDKPRFCPKCGESVDGTAKSTAPALVEELDEAVTVEADYDLDKIRRGITSDYNNQALKMGEVVGTAEGDGSTMKRRPSNLPDGDALLKQSIQDCQKVSRAQDIDER